MSGGVTTDPMRAGTPIVWFAAGVIDRMAAEAARTFPLETGGVLMGYTDAIGADVVVRECIGPGPHAVHHGSAFVPDHIYHEQEVARIYAQSGRVWTYLGDWHSHPDGRLELSTADRRTVKWIARAVDARAPNPIMALIAGRATPVDDDAVGNGTSGTVEDFQRCGWSIGAWRLDSRSPRWSAIFQRRRLVRCSVATFNASIRHCD